MRFRRSNTPLEQEQTRLEQLLLRTNLKKELREQAIHLVQLEYAQYYNDKSCLDVFTSATTRVEGTNTLRTAAVRYVTRAVCVNEGNINGWTVIKTGEGHFSTPIASLEAFISSLRREMEVLAVSQQRLLGDMARPDLTGE